ncbi:MAG: hypothetical protein SGJ11_17860, partial [Phycisphaerae bacterium]|nr:hypothetical protein [Phycisphaerae bacterium]
MNAINVVNLLQSCVLATMLLQTAAPSVPAGTPAPAIAHTARSWTTRLEALTPVQPDGYFELAEEVADAATTAEERELARTLFGLAGTLDTQRLGRSSALGQASLVTDERQQRTLRALAALLDASGVGMVTESRGDASTSLSAAMALSEAFSHLRRGQGPRALGIVKAPEVNALLEVYGSHMPGGPERFREDCRVYKGGVRPSLSPEQLVTMLRMEEAMLSAPGAGSSRRWSSSLIETSGRPLLEIDTSALDIAFGVNPKRPYWRKGAWVG